VVLPAALALVFVIPRGILFQIWVAEVIGLTLIGLIFLAGMWVVVYAFIRATPG